MSDSIQPTATNDDQIVDPEILALLDFEPVPRAREAENAWTPELQREFIARLAVHGSATKACEEMGKNRTGVTKLYRSPQGASFRDAWHAAVDLAKQRRATTAQFVSPGTRPPTIDNRRKNQWVEPAGPLPGQVMNEYGEWEDEESCLQRAEEAKDSIASKLLRIRRLYLQEISSSAGKRAAFEILTELPIDWEKAEALQPQPDEPYNPVRMRKPDMILTAESGWSFGEIGYGPDRKAEMRKAIDEHRAAEGLEPIEWD